MRTLLVLCLCSLAFGGLAGGQGVDATPCAAVSLRAFLNRRAESLELAERIEATALVDDLVALAAEYIDTVQVLPFSASFCHEGYDTTWRLEQLLHDTYAAQVMRLLGVADEDNTYLLALPFDRQLVEEQRQRLEALLESGERDGLQSTATGSGDECFYEDLIYPVEQWLAHKPLMEGVESIETVADVLAVGRDMNAWRGRTWSMLPACFEPFLHLMELSQLAQFVSMQRALAMAGVREADDPFAEAIDQMLKPRWGYFGGGFRDVRLRAWTRPAPTVIGIATCSIAELESFAHIPAEFDNILAEALSAVDTEQKLAFIKRQVAWRHRLWLQLPMCREVLEMTWLMRQISSDQATVFALQLLADDNSNAAPTVATHAEARDGQRLRQLRERFDAYLKGANVDLPKTAEAAFFTCGDQLSEDEYDGIIAGFRKMMGQAREISSADDAAAYFADQVRWRDGYLAGLPACPEAIEYGWWTALLTTSDALSAVMKLAGLPEKDNPYVVEGELAFRRWFKFLTEFHRGKSIPKQQGAPSASRLRSCAEDDVSIIVGAEQTYDELLGYPTWFSTDELVGYAKTYLEWRDDAFGDFPPCAEAQEIRLDFTQIVGDAIARRLLDIDGRLYGDSPWRQLPEDFLRYERLDEALFEAHLVSGPRPAERVVPVCSAEEIDIVADLASGIMAIARSAESFELGMALPAFHWEILNWRGDLMARLPQCAGAVELGWLMNDIHIDLAVLGSLSFVGADIEALHHAKLIEENLARMVYQAQALGIEGIAAPGP